MATTKSLTIVDSAGQVIGSNDIGAEAQNIEIARDAEGKIITDIYEPGVVIQSRQGVAEALKNIEEAGSGLIFDDVPTVGSENPVKSDGLVPDDGLDLESSRPVENRVITERLNEKISNFETSPSSWDTVPTQNSGKPITSGGVYSALNNVHITVDDTLSTTSANPVQNNVITSALNNKQNALTFDNVPTENSNNPVTSDGVYSALNNLATMKNIIDSPTTGNIGGVVEGATRFIEREDTPTLRGNIIPNLASGDFSHAEGVSSSYISDISGQPKLFRTIASGLASHAEGQYTEASGIGSHAEGRYTIASSEYSHAEGDGAKASNYNSHAEGSETIASGQGSHAEGQNTKASGTGSHAEGMLTSASGNQTHAEGYRTIASGDLSHTEGDTTIASGQTSHAEGIMTSASGDYSHAEGYETSASGVNSHAEGAETSASGNCSHAEGDRTRANSEYSHAEGYNTRANGNYSHAEGFQTTASGEGSHAAGCQTIANYYQTTVGQYNVSKGSTDSYTANSGYFIVGAGTDSITKANCFRATETNTYGKTYTTSGADYAEMFEWADGNINNEDRVGKFVTLDEDKIKLATSSDDYILGIVSGNASVIGDVYDDQWQGIFETDIYGRPIYEKQERELEDGTKVYDDVLKVNPNYDNTQKYIPRSERSEWDAVGLLGKLICLDDGTVEANDYVTVNNDSIATKASNRTKYRVMKRVDENHIQIMIL